MASSPLAATSSAISGGVDGPAFSRRAPVAGAHGVLVQPGFARSPFTPARPVQTAAGLIGRQRQVERAISAIEVERAHLAIFGERGLGKTSLANVVASLAEAAGYGVVRHACSADAGFSELIGAVLNKVPARFLRRDPAGADDPALRTGGELAEPQMATEWTVSDATAILERIRAGHLLIFVDEFDRLADADSRRDITELLKNVSDLGLRVSFVLVGVAESLGELLALHPSIHRSLVAISLPLLTNADLMVLIERGCRELGLQVTSAARERLLLLSHQSPYYAQLLSLHATNMTCSRNGDSVTQSDVAAAAATVLEETQHLFADLQVMLPPPGSAAARLPLAAARAPCDGFGWFTATALDADGAALSEDVAEALRSLTRAEAGPILRRRMLGGGEQFAFAQVNLRNYVLLREVGQREPA